MDPPIRIDPLGHLEPEVAGDDRGRPHLEEIVQVWSILPSDLEDIAEPGGRDQGRPRPRPLEDGVRRHRRSVRQPVDPVRVDPAGSDLLCQGGNHPISRGKRSRGDLDRPEILAVGDDDIDERPADVDPDRSCHPEWSIGAPDPLLNRP